MNVVSKKNKTMNNFFLNQAENKEIFIRNSKSFNFCLEKNSSLYIKNVIFKPDNNVINISGNFKEKSIFKYVIADFSPGNTSLNINLDLGNPGLQVDVSIFCLSFKDNQKKFNICLNNKNKNIKTNIDSFGIAFDQSKIHFLNTCIAQKKSKKNILSQKGKIIIFDKKATGSIQPILKIFENDVSATHNASIGYFNNDYFFYLLSRGLKTTDIKKMLINGFLRQASRFFDKNVNEEINEVVKKYVQC
ncbi:MAG: SufD family Fe-S cluster assembly protein [Bacilli bacterium]|nr:SufD family Fe-S cluster assembly protein [Bacilli bacterium]